MRPFYADDAVTIYHGSSLEILSVLLPLSVPYDVVVTDPPYGTGGWRRLSTGAGSDPRASLVREEWDDGAVEWLHHVNGPILTFWSAARTWELLSAARQSGRGKHRALYLRKPDPKPQVGGRTAWSIEPVWSLSADGFLLNGGDDLFVASAPRLHRDADATGHPYEKPLAFMRWLIGKTTAGTILDPFMGSGTTLRAAKDLGRRAIGIELDERWCKAAARRMAQEPLGLTEVPA